MSDDTAVLRPAGGPIGGDPRQASFGRTDAAQPKPALSRLNAARQGRDAIKRNLSTAETIGAAAIRRGLATREQIDGALADDLIGALDGKHLHPGERLIRAGVLTAAQLATLLSDRAPGYRLLEDGVRLATMLNQSFSGARRTITVAGVTTRAGSDVLMASIAVAAALMHERRTVLIDCDVQRPSLHRLFDVPQENGTLAGLAGKQSAQMVPQATGLPGLSVIPCEAASPAAADGFLDEGATTRLFLAGGQERLALVSSPPLLTSPEALTLASRSDAVLLVIPASGCRRADLDEVTRRLDFAGATTLGIVMTRDGR